MKLLFLGAAGTVTGSKTLIKYNEQSYLIDCGLYQGENSLTLKNQQLLEQGVVKNLQGVFITHAHLDHCGYLPYLVSQGYSGPIFMTAPTKELVQLVLEDALSIMSAELKAKKSEKMPYTDDDLAKVISMIVVKDKDQQYKHQQLQFQFLEAGHILGASSLVVKWQGNNLLFTGDLGRSDDLVHVSPKITDEEIDAVIMEGTYGGRSHSHLPLAPQLFEAIDHIKSREGVLLIPCFAIARSAIVLKTLHDYFSEYPQHKLRVYVDSPMMLKALRVYEKFADQLKISSDELKEILTSVKLVEFPKERSKLSKSAPPYILVSSSGMLSGGRSVEHFERRAIKDSNYILLVGYQGEGTMGRKILEGEKSFLAYGKETEIKAPIGQLTQLSAHADEEQMLSYLKELNPGKIFINHAEKSAANALKTKITSIKDNKVIVAHENQEYEI